jgi:hypothetical protein
VWCGGETYVSFRAVLAKTVDIRYNLISYENC